MPESKRPLKVFLCHASADKTAVRELYQRLTKDGVDAWLDKEKLLPGQDWEYEIRKAVREADVVVVCLSKQFNQAGFRQKEVRLALDTAMEKPEGEIFIIPARLEECDNLESLRRWHWVDLFEEDGYKRLFLSLRRSADESFITSNAGINLNLELISTLGHEKSVWKIAFSPNDSQLASITEQFCRIWDWKTEIETTKLSHNTYKIYDNFEMLFSSSGNFLVYAAGWAIKFFDVKNKISFDVHRRKMAEWRGAPIGVKALTITPDENTLILAWADKKIQFWNVKKQKDVKMISLNGGLINCLAVSNDGKLLVSGSDDGQLTYWNLYLFERYKSLKISDDTISCVCFQPNSHLVASSCGWSAFLHQNGEQVKLNTHKGIINNLLFDPSGRLLLSTSLDGQ